MPEKQKSLRPVEKYYLFHYWKKTEWDITYAVALVIEYLYAAGLVQIHQKTLVAVKGHEKFQPFLKGYEFLVLNAIAYPSSHGLIDAIENYSFLEDLSKQGCLTRQRVSLFSTSWPTYSLTKHGQDILEEIRYRPPMLFRGISPEIIVYVDIAKKISEHKMISVSISFNKASYAVG